MPQVLVIEDDPDVREAVGRLLAATGHVVRVCGTALDGLREVAVWSPDVVVLDLGLPDLDGAAVLRRIRASSQVPVLVATARVQESEMIRLLRAGADDYVVKPYSAEQVEARIAALLRRGGTPVQAPAELTVGGLVVDPQGRTASLDGVPLSLSRREFDLLAYLARRAGTVVTRRQLLQDVWPADSRSAETVDVHVTWLRRKLGERAVDPRYLHTVRGVGVRLSAPEERPT
jgi:DNA-binding response OmpR family regulator